MVAGYQYNMENEGSQHTSGMPRVFSLQLLQHITNNFSQESVIGKGGYGVVYKGVLDNGEEIAVKKLYNQPGIDDDRFKNELTNLMAAQHQYIVRLVGYCYDIQNRLVPHNGRLIFASVEERALCLEYLHAGSLDKFLSDESCGLDWHTRYKIIKGVCEGLKYLHTGSEDPIYHLDLKPANILLDKNMTPKIGDFGLSRLFGSAQTCVTKTVTGSCGYMPPEYIDARQISPKFDVFSLGVIIIQVVAGVEGYYKSPDMTPQEFIEFVHENWGRRLQSAMSSHISKQVKACIEIALRCVEHSRQKRPTLAEILDELNKIDAADNSPITHEVLSSETSHSQCVTRVHRPLPRGAFLAFRVLRFTVSYFWSRTFS